MIDNLPPVDLPETVPDAYPLAQLAGEATRILREFPDFVGEPEMRARLLHSWLIWSQSDSKDARMRWSYLAESGQLPDRDAYVLALWRRVVAEGSLVELVKSSGPWSYYQRHFFGWFLARFNLRAARTVFCDSPLVRGFHLLLAGAAIFLAGLALFPHPVLDVSILFLVLASLIFISGLLLGLPPYAYVNSLIPRLGATVGIGYLFLFNAPQIVRIIYQSHRPSRQLWMASAALLLMALAYITVHIWRRVHPPLDDFRLLLARSLDLWVIAVCYAAAGLVVTAPILFSSSLLFGPNGEFPKVVARPEHLALVAAIALNLGVVLQLAWDEKPLTEPL